MRKNEPVSDRDARDPHRRRCVKGRCVTVRDEHVRPQGAQASTIRGETHGETPCQPLPRNKGIDLDAPEVPKHPKRIAAREQMHVMTVRPQRRNERARPHPMTTPVPMHEISDTH